MDNINEAIKFFETCIYHYKIMLNGIMRDEYREYINNLVLYYSLSIEALKKTNVETNIRCLTCANYPNEKEVPPICYFCYKGIEDNYRAKEETTA